jgi:uncharacterized protein YdeI (YjbR/CyaY-like superfamily)
MPIGVDEHRSARFFRSPAEFRAWLTRHHATARVIWVGYHKRATGRPSLTWSESVDVALCFGWIDGVRRSLDAERYANRFTPRSPNSGWSAVNLAKVERLIAAGLMQPAGLAVYQARDRSRPPGSVRTEIPLAREYVMLFQRNRAAWTFFQAQSPWYRRTVSRWVMDAKKDETRRRRLATLIEDSAQKRFIGPLRRPGR